jgi:PmbA protein
MLEDKNLYLKELKECVNQVLLLAHKSKVQCEVIGSISIGLSANVRKQQLDTLEFNNNKKLCITLYDGYNQGTVSITDLSFKSIEDAFFKAISIARLTDSDPYAGLADPSLMAKKIIDLDLYHPETSEIELFINTAKICEEAALAEPSITNSEGATFTCNNNFTAVGNSNDFFSMYPSSSYSLSCSAIAKNNDHMQRDFDFTCARSLKNLIKPSIIGKRSAIYAHQRLGAHKIATKKTKVLFLPEVAAELIGYLIDAISGYNIANKSSFLIDRLDHKIFPEFVNIIDEPLIKQGLRSAAFDIDGLATKTQPIVTNGVLNTYLLNNYFAKKLQLKPTGHASGIHNLFVLDANKSPSLNKIYNPSNFQQPNAANNAYKLKLEGCSSLIKAMDTGLIVTETIGHGVNLVTGDYSKGIFGFWVKGGEIVHPVEETTIASNLQDMFKNILAIDQDFNLQSNIISGSMLMDNITIS